MAAPIYRLQDMPVGARVRISGYGWAIRPRHIGLTGRVVRHNRVTATVQLDAPGQYGETELRVHPPCARIIEGES